MPKIGYLLLLGGAGAIGAIFVGRAMLSASSYQECMVREMRGLPQIMYGNVDKLCSQRFQREVEVYGQRDHIEWSYKDFHVLIKAQSAKSEYVVTRGKFRFSSKSCEESSADDFAVERTVDVGADGDFYFFLSPTLKEYEKFSTPKCMKTLDLWGRYR